MDEQNCPECGAEMIEGKCPECEAEAESEITDSFEE